MTPRIWAGFGYLIIIHIVYRYSSNISARQTLIPILWYYTYECPRKDSSDILDFIISIYSLNLIISFLLSEWRLLSLLNFYAIIALININWSFQFIKTLWQVMSSKRGGPRCLWKEKEHWFDPPRWEKNWEGSSSEGVQNAHLSPSSKVWTNLWSKMIYKINVREGVWVYI